jgi:endonuclease/exonuclease/phosphatase (EEP) superfamily protein YafD
VRTRVLVLWVAVALLLVPAAAITFARAVEPHVGFWIRVEAFTPLGIVLYAAALIVLAVRLLVHRRVRSPAAVLAVVAAAGLVVHGWWFAPQVTGANPPPATGADPLVVMSANIAQGTADGIDLVGLADARGVDLLVVQEIAPADLADMERAGLTDLLPYRAGEPGTNGNGTMLFARTELGTAEPLGTGHDGWVVDLGDLTVLGVHPWAPTDVDVWRADLAVVHQAAVDHDADLVVGDFNATADHEPMRSLADAGYRDVGELANEGWQPTWPSGGAVEVLGVPVPSLVQIDHVLVGPRLAGLTMDTLALSDSDHRVVVAEVARK